jgi:hypothetical protein
MNVLGSAKADRDSGSFHDDLRGAEASVHRAEASNRQMVVL